MIQEYVRDIYTYLAKINIKAAMIIKIAKQTIGIRQETGSITPSWISPTIGANIAKPNVPQANCLPTSPLPVDVSLVAIIIAASNNVTAAVGNMSAMDLIIKYVQKVVDGFPITWTHWLSARTLSGAYG